MSQEDEGFDLDSAIDDISDSIGAPDEENDVGGDETLGLSEETKAEEKVSEETTEATVSRDAPKSWAADKRETWAALPDDTKDYIELREKQMLDGIEQYKDGHNFALYIDQAIAPYRDIISANGVDEAQAIINLFEHHKALTTGTIEQRQQALVNIGMSAGIIPQHGQVTIDPAVADMLQRISAIEAQEGQRRQAYEKKALAGAQAELNAFVKDRPDFDELADDVAKFMRAGDDLQAAYDRAKWSNPATRAREIEAMRKVEIEKAKEEALKARKSSSANIRQSKTGGEPEQPLGTWDDTMREALAKMRG